MKLLITAKTGAKQPGVEKITQGHYRVSVKAPPKDGEANRAILEVLAAYFDKPKSRFEILSGHKSKTKVIQFR